MRRTAGWRVASNEIGQSAKTHGHDLLLKGFTIEQVVHDYGDVCQSVTDLAVEMGAPISTDDFRTLNRCLDNAIAGAVTEFTLKQSVNEDKAFAELENLTTRRLPGSRRSARAMSESEDTPQPSSNAVSWP